LLFFVSTGTAECFPVSRFACLPDIPDIIGQARRLLELIPLIFQTDSTRIVGITSLDHFAVPQVAGVTRNHHSLSHHGQDTAKTAQ